MMGRRQCKKGQFFYSFDLDKVVPPEQIWNSGTMLFIHLRCTKQKIFANTSTKSLPSLARRLDITLGQFLGIDSAVGL